MAARLQEDRWHEIFWFVANAVIFQKRLYEWTKIWSSVCPQGLAAIAKGAALHHLAVPPEPLPPLQIVQKKPPAVGQAMAERKGKTSLTKLKTMGWKGEKKWFVYCQPNKASQIDNSLQASNYSAKVSNGVGKRKKCLFPLVAVCIKVNSLLWGLGSGLSCRRSPSGQPSGLGWVGNRMKFELWVALPSKQYMHAHRALQRR